MRRWSGHFHRAQAKNRIHKAKLLSGAPHPRGKGTRVSPLYTRLSHIRKADRLSLSPPGKGPG